MTQHETFADMIICFGGLCAFLTICAAIIGLLFAVLLGLDWAHQRYNRYRFGKTLADLRIGAGAKREALAKFEELQHTHFSTKVLVAETSEEFFNIPGEIIMPRIADYGLIKFVVSDYPDVKVFSVWVYYTDNAPRRQLKDAADYEAAYEWWQLLIEAVHYGVECSEVADYIQHQLQMYIREHQRQYV